MGSRAEPAGRARALPVAGLLAGALLAGCTGQDPDDCALCVEADPVVVGATLPLTGPLGASGAAQRRGVEGVVTRANEAGGVDVGGERRTVELVVLDSRGDADVAGQNALVLVRRREPVSALLGACGAPLTVVLVAEARGVPLLDGCGPLAMPAGPSTPAHARYLGPAPAEHAGAVVAALGPGGPVAVLAGGGRSTAAAEQALADAGVPRAGTWARAGQDSTGGWSDAVTAARASAATRVLALTEPPDGLALWRELARQGWRPDAAYVPDAGVTTAWASLPRSDGVLTDVHAPDAPTVEDAVEQASAAAAQELLAALARAGSDRRTDVGKALSVGPARLLGSTSPGPPARLGTWRAGELVALTR